MPQMSRASSQRTKRCVLPRWTDFSSSVTRLWFLSSFSFMFVSSHLLCVTTEHLFATYEFRQGASKQLNNRCCRFIKSNFTSATSRAATNDYFRFEEVDVLKCFVFFHKPKIQEDVRNQKIIPFEKLKSDHFDVFFKIDSERLIDYQNTLPLI